MVYKNTLFIHKGVGASTTVNVVNPVFQSSCLIVAKRNSACYSMQLRQLYYPRFETTFDFPRYDILVFARQNQFQPPYQYLYTHFT